MKNTITTVLLITPSVNVMACVPTSPPINDNFPVTSNAWATNVGPASFGSYGVDALSCSRCPGKLEQFCEIFDSDAIEKILAHLGYLTEVPKANPARAPPCPSSQNAGSKQVSLSEEEISHLPLELQEQTLNQEPPFEFVEEDFNPRGRGVLSGPWAKGREDQGQRRQGHQHPRYREKW